MFKRESKLGYQSASADGATQIGLLSIVYAAMAEDLRSAGRAVQAGDIAARCRASNHALALLGHVESWQLDSSDGRLSASLSAFYQSVRQQILFLQINGASPAFEALSETLLSLRATWQVKEQELLHTHKASSQAAVNQALTDGEAQLAARGSAWCA